MFQLSDEQSSLRDRARALGESLRDRAAEIDRTEEYPWDSVAKLKEAGFLGMTLPRELGGQGLGWLEAAVVTEEIARGCAVSARIVVETNMGCISAVTAYGSEAQRRLAAGMVLEGDKPAICITEPGAGSAATEMTTTARRVGGGWVLNGRKHWITGGGVSRLHLVFARMVEDGADRGIGGFLAIRDETKGLRIGRREPTMGLRGIPEAEILFEDMFVADDMALIQGGDGRRGFAKLMTAYNSQRVGRGLGRARHRAGRPRACAGLCPAPRAVRQADRRVPGAAMDAGRHGDRSVRVPGADLKAAASDRDGFPDMGLAAQAKILAAETAVKVTNDALQLHGAAGYSRDLPLERMVRDARMFTIGGGTAQVLRTQVASALLGRKLPQTRDGYLRDDRALAAE